jgi:hypothetical protein
MTLSQALIWDDPIALGTEDFLLPWYCTRLIIFHLSGCTIFVNFSSFPCSISPLIMADLQSLPPLHYTCCIGKLLFAHDFNPSFRLYWHCLFYILDRGRYFHSSLAWRLEALYESNLRHRFTVEDKWPNLSVSVSSSTKRGIITVCLRRLLWRLNE